MTESLDPILRNRLLRFLHTGNEVPKYFPGCWSSHKYFEVDKLKAIDDALANGSKNAEILDIILKAYHDNMYTRFETIAFALTKCLLLGSPAMKEATYKAVVEVCKTPEQLMLFSKYSRVFKTGNGQGWCKAVRAWYITKDPMELAKEITRVRSRHGRSHKTLIRKSHIKIAANDHARDAVIKYAIFGYKRAKQLVGEKVETRDIFDYIQKVEKMRVCEDPAIAGMMAAENHFTLDHVPGHLLISQDVWNAVLPQMSLEDILYNLQRIHNMGFLSSESSTLAILSSLLSDQQFINKFNVTPLHVYITLQNYKKKTKPLKHEKVVMSVEKERRRRARQIFDSNTGLWEWNVTRRHPKEIKIWGIEQPPSAEVIETLEKLIDLTWLLSTPTGKRYMITLDMRHHMFKGRHFCKNFVVPKKQATNESGKITIIKSKKSKKQATIKNVATTSANSGAGDAEPEKKSKKRLLAECFYNTHVTPGHAAIILALQILKREQNVKLAVFSEEGVELISINRNFSSIEEAEFVFRKSNLGRVQLDAPILWANNGNHKVDVFINMIDRARARPLPRARAAALPPQPPPAARQIDNYVAGVSSCSNYRR